MLTMPLSGIERREELSTQKAAAHHAFAAAKRFPQPLEIMAWGQLKLLMDFMEKVNGVAVVCTQPHAH